MLEITRPERRMVTLVFCLIPLQVGCKYQQSNPLPWEDELLVTALPYDHRFDPIDRDALRGLGDTVSYRIESSIGGESESWVLELRTLDAAESGDPTSRADPI
mgnify:CR=1 FL=1